MRNLTNDFHKKDLLAWTQQQAATLLRIDSCLLAGRGVMLSGGAVRDAYFGEVPKDFDFAFYNAADHEVWECLRQFIARSPYEVEVTEFPAHEYDDARVGLVLKVTEYRGHTPYCMDWIVYRSAKTREAVLDTFDHSINAFFMQYDEEFRLTVGYHGEWGVCTRNANTECTPERVERFKEMARVLDWEYR